MPSRETLRRGGQAAAAEGFLGGGEREEAGSVDELDVVWPGDLVADGALERDAQVLAAAGVACDDRRAGGVGLVTIAPLPEGQQDRRQLAALVGHAVLVAGSAPGLAVPRPLEDAFIDELAQPLGQHVARAPQHLMELLE